MMKRENSAERDAGPFPGPELEATPITVEQMEQMMAEALAQAEAVFEDLFGIETE